MAVPLDNIRMIGLKPARILECIDAVAVDYSKTKGAMYSERSAEANLKNES